MTYPASKTVARIGLLLATCLVLSGCDAPVGTWGWYVIDPQTPAGLTNIKFLISGFWNTITLSVIAALISAILGLLIALPGMSSNRWIRLPSRIYIELVRAIPLLPLLFWIFYGLPVVLKSIGISISIDPFWGAVLTLALSDSAFTAEIYRTGIQSVPPGQTEAARTLGLNYRQTMRFIILPQAIRSILPALANQFIYIVKMSAFASVIGMQELTRRANELVVTEYRPLEIYTLLVLEYLVLVLIISFGVRWLERKMNTEHKG